MYPDKKSLPLAVAKLLVAYFNQTITPEEHDRLDAWLTESYENMEIFSECIDITTRPFVYNSERTVPNEIIPDRVTLN